MPDRRELWHGTLGGYTNHGCRCEKCRAANAAYHREYSKRKTRTRRPRALK